MSIDGLLLDLIKCARESDTCANEHIVESPLALSCGHGICSSCRQSNEQKIFNCRIHGPSEIGEHASSLNYLIHSQVKHLFNFLSNKAEHCATDLKS